MTGIHNGAMLNDNPPKHIQQMPLHPHHPPFLFLITVLPLGNMPVPNSL